MKTHLYQLEVFESVMDLTHDMSQTQNRLYIPGQGVLAYRSKEQIDFFSDNKEVIAEAEKAIRGELETEGEAKYLGEIELPDDSVSRVVLAGKALNEAREVFNASSKTLVDLLPK